MILLVLLPFIGLTWTLPEQGQNVTKKPAVSKGTIASPKNSKSLLLPEASRSSSTFSQSSQITSVISTSVAVPSQSTSSRSKSPLVSNSDLFSKNSTTVIIYKIAPSSTHAHKSTQHVTSTRPEIETLMSSLSSIRKKQSSEQSSGISTKYPKISLSSSSSPSYSPFKESTPHFAVSSLFSSRSTRHQSFHSSLRPSSMSKSNTLYSTSELSSKPYTTLPTQLLSSSIRSSRSHILHITSHTSITPRSSSAASVSTYIANQIVKYSNGSNYTSFSSSIKKTPSLSAFTSVESSNAVSSSYQTDSSSVQVSLTKPLVPKGLATIPESHVYKQTVSYSKVLYSSIFTFTSIQKQIPSFVSIQKDFERSKSAVAKESIPKPKVMGRTHATSSYWPLRSSGVVAITGNTRIVTIKTSKNRGLPPWAVITVAVGAFLFVCLIALAAFKIVQWNKDHGDYKLWSTDLELTPITSRMEKDLLLDKGSSYYEKPLRRSDEDIKIYSEGRCVSVVTAKQNVNSIEVEVSYPLKSEAKLSTNNNLKDVSCSNHEDIKMHLEAEECHGSPSSLQESSVFNIEFYDSPVKRDTVNSRLSSSQTSSSSESSSDDQKEQGCKSEPKYSSIDELGLIAFNPNDFFCQGFDAYKPLPATPSVKTGKWLYKRARASSLDNDIESQENRNQCPPILSSKSNPDFYSSRCRSPTGNGHMSPHQSQTLRNKFAVPPRPPKGCALGEQRVRHEMKDVGEFMSSNSQEQLADIDFSSGRRTRSLPRPRRCKKSLEARHWPLARNTKKCNMQLDGPSVDPGKSEDSLSISAAEERKVSEPEIAPVSESSENTQLSASRQTLHYSSPPPPLPTEAVFNKGRRGSKDFVEVEIGCGRPRLVSRDESRPCDLKTRSLPRGRSTSTPVATSDYLKRLHATRNSSNDARPSHEPSLNNGSLTQRRKFSSPACASMEKYTGVVKSHPFYNTENRLLPKRVESRIRDNSMDSLPRVVEATEKGSENEEGENLLNEGTSAESHSLLPYAEVRLSAVLSLCSTAMPELHRPPRSNRPVLPYLTIDLEKRESSSSNEEPTTPAGGYLRIVPSPKSLATGSQLQPPEPVYWYPNLADGEITNLRNHSDVDSAVSPGGAVNSDTEDSKKNVYEEIDSYDTLMKNHTYERLKSDDVGNRLSIISIPEPGYEAVKRRQSLLITPSRDSVDSAVFSSCEDTFRAPSELRSNERDFSGRHIDTKTSSSESMHSSNSAEIFFSNSSGKGVTNTDSFRMVQNQGVDAQRRRQDATDPIDYVI